MDKEQTKDSRDGRHAFLIIAHDQFSLLRNLIALLRSDKRCYVYLHIDKKSEMPRWIAEQSDSKINVLQNRIDVRWGDYSQVRVEMLLFDAAYKDGPYQYYHLLSGVDLPIKPMSVLLDFFDSHKGMEFVGFVFNFAPQRITKFHFLTRHYRNKNKWIAMAYYIVRGIMERFVRLTIGERSIEGIKLAKGCNWVSITNDFCGYLLSKSKFIESHFKHTFGADEFFVHTILWNSPPPISKIRFTVWMMKMKAQKGKLIGKGVDRIFGVNHLMITNC